LVKSLEIIATYFWLEKGKKLTNSPMWMGK